MNAVRSKTAADLRRRKLQAMVIALVILLSSGAATLALSLLVESDAPYDHAFAQANGAHLTLRFAANRVTMSAWSWGRKATIFVRIRPSAVATRRPVSSQGLVSAVSRIRAYSGRTGCIQSTRAAPR